MEAGDIPTRSGLSGYLLSLLKTFTRSIELAREVEKNWESIVISYCLRVLFNDAHNINRQPLHRGTADHVQATFCLGSISSFRPKCCIGSPVTLGQTRHLGHAFCCCLKASSALSLSSSFWYQTKVHNALPPPRQDWPKYHTRS